MSLAVMPSETSFVGFLFRL